MTAPDLTTVINRAGSEGIPERMVPSEFKGDPSLEDHQGRYRFAAANLLPGTVLDAACGVGYGTQFLCKEAGLEEALGIDLCSATLEFARQHYPHPRARFQELDVMKNCISQSSV